ncbi:reactive oxygen species modulator 1-like [Peromyscus eremicus]|uniref:reactive oxygen species modulator 1-like n=1 Tax=Peromyscus eremicus TaxID=42410 RepID=UPI0027DD145C|nr:reactive oxygen species modulator 1-like [Peromyscus eremicus]
MTEAQEGERSFLHTRETFVVVVGSSRRAVSRVTTVANKILVAMGPYGQFQPSCSHCLKMGFVMRFAVGMEARVLYGRYLLLSQEENMGLEPMDAFGKTMMQNGSTFGTFMAIGMGKGWAVFACYSYTFPSISTLV